MNTIVNHLVGGQFILQPSDYNETFIPEEKSEEQNMIMQSTRDFVINEIHPIWKRIEAKEEGLSPELFLKMGELGLLGANIPESYGGMELDANTIALLLTAIGDMGSFNTPYAAHTGIGMLPILYFGTEEQKKTYLPPMVRGELIGSYCLTEPTSGSDALSAKTQAVFDKEKNQYILNGQKMWISNAGYAGIFIVFAQVDGDKFTGFLVPRNAPGLTLGAEEEKLGIHGSSTRQVYLENVAIPANNVLGEVGKGHLIAFNVLNMGRFKLGALCVAGAKRCMNISTTYANQRIQFKQPISSFGAIKEKLAWQCVLTAALESATLRISHLLSSKISQLKSEGMEPTMAKLQAAKEFAVECSIIKVAGSEIIDNIADETVQVYGGMGYSEEAEPARIYRDSRINRIYEGTNEINRLLIVDQLVKRGMKGELPLMQMFAGGQPEVQLEDYCKEAHEVRTLVIKLLGYLGRRQMEGKLDLDKEQEITMALSDLGIYTFLLESLWMRMKKRESLTSESHDEWKAMFQLYHYQVASQCDRFIFVILSRLFDGPTLHDKFIKCKEIVSFPAIDVVANQRLVAKWMIDNDGVVL